MNAKTQYIGDSEEPANAHLPNLISIYKKRYAKARLLHNLRILVIFLSIICLVGCLIISDDLRGDAEIHLNVMGVILLISGWLWAFIIGVIASILETAIDSAIYQLPSLSEESKISLVLSSGETVNGINTTHYRAERRAKSIFWMNFSVVMLILCLIVIAVVTL